LQLFDFTYIIFKKFRQWTFATISEVKLIRVAPVKNQDIIL